MDDPRREFLEAFGEGAPFLCSLATVNADGGASVRFVRAKVDRELTLRIPTFAGTDKVREIRADGRVCVICGDTDSEHPGTYFRVDGTAEVCTDSAERKACWTPLLEKWFSDPEDENYAVVKVTPTAILASPIGRAGAPAAWRAEPA